MMQGSIIKRTENYLNPVLHNLDQNDCGALLEKKNKTVSRKQRLLSFGNLALILDASCSY